MSKKYLISFFTILIIFIISVPLIEYHFFFNEQKAVQFDLKGTAQEFIDGLSKQPHQNAQSMQKIVSKFTVLMQKDLDNYSLNHKAQIFVSAAVISGLPDITNEIKAELFDQLSKDQRGNQ